MMYPIVHIPDPVGHAFASPSRLATLKLCPYCAHNCERWEEPESEAASRGRLMHEAIYNNTALKKLSAEDRQIVLDLREDFIRPCRTFELWYEKLVYLRDESGKIVTYGTVDFLAIMGDKAMLIDWKFGKSPVPGFQFNPQLRAYVAAVFQTFSQIQTIYPMIAQPSRGFDYKEQVEVTRDMLPQLLRETEEIVSAAMKAKWEDAVPSHDACYFCNKDRCRKYQAEMIGALEAYGIADVAMIDPTNASQFLPIPELLDWCDTSLMRLEPIKAFIKDREDKIKAYIKAANGSANFRLTKPVERTIVDYKSMITDLGIAPDVVARYTTIRIGEPSLVRKTKKRG